MLQDSTVKTGVSEDGADERRHALQYWLNSVTWCMRSGALNVILMKTIFLVTAYSDILSLCSSFSLSDQVSHPYQTRGKFIFILVIILE